MKFPQVKLPKIGKRHPLLDGLDAVVEREGWSRRYIAKRELKLSQQAVDAWCQKAKKNRNFNVPPRQIIKICRVTGQAPFLYNPELWPNPEWRV